MLGSLGDTVRFPEQLNSRFGVNGLGTVFRWSSQDVEGGAPFVLTAPSSGYAEAFRQIRANLEFATANQPGNIYMVSSPGPGEGKSTIISNLAIALAQTGRRILVIDGDLRRPTLHAFFNGVQRVPGLSNFLADPNASFADVIQPTQVEGVDIIPSGPTPPNPGDLLVSPKMGVFMRQVKGDYDLVLIDSPPLLIAADGSVMASQTDGTLVVVDGFGTRSSSLLAALDNLRNAKTTVLGVIINKLRRSRFGYGYGYGYGYQYYYTYYYQQDESNVDGTGRIHRRLVQPAKKVWSRIRRTRVDDRGR